MSKENEKIIINCVKKIAKQNHFKTISNCIYKTDGNLVIYAVVWATDNHTIAFRWCIKTIFFGIYLICQIIKMKDLV